MEDDFGEKFQKKVVGKIQYSASRNKHNVKITVGLPCGRCIAWWRFGQYYKYKKLAYMIFNLKLKKKILFQLVCLDLYKDIIIVNMQKKSWENICKYGFYGPLLLGNLMEIREMRQCSPSSDWLHKQWLSLSTSDAIHCHTDTMPLHTKRPKHTPIAPNNFHKLKNVPCNKK